MAVLEEEGYIAQPHTSAGRVPTDKGYRLFVDPAVAGQTPFGRRAAGDPDPPGRCGPISTTSWPETVRLLASLTNQVAVVQYPSRDPLDRPARRTGFRSAAPGRCSWSSRIPARRAGGSSRSAPSRASRSLGDLRARLNAVVCGRRAHRGAGLGRVPCRVPCRRRIGPVARAVIDALNDTVAIES